MKRKFLVLVSVLVMMFVLSVGSAAASTSDEECRVVAVGEQVCDGSGALDVEQESSNNVERRLGIMQSVEPVLEDSEPSSGNTYFDYAINSLS